ncbi:hypothetical protein [Cohnella pontilimi]|uniref:hypothetical protein n=1 Tax=Cohnella pontilimi TaxID=2564100 RepID=UPI00145E9E14|nr:hypothetical protein [Cohnella pontilimi]
MSEKEYRYADLKPEVVEEIRLTEKRISEKTGQPITLIAYRSDAAAEEDPTAMI